MDEKAGKKSCARETKGVYTRVLEKNDERQECGIMASRHEKGD